jgi:LPXTG-motif cell wall-anchored protein
MLTVGGLAAPSVATTLPICGQGSGSGEIPGQTCEVAVVATPECVDDVAVLEYAVRPGGAPGASTVDITFTGVPGGDVVLADQPLSGTVQYPARATAATVVFGTTPAVRVPSVPNPCSESGVLGAADRTPSRSGARSASGVLAATGMEASTLALGAGGLLVAGTALVLVRRRRHGIAE